MSPPMKKPRKVRPAPIKAPTVWSVETFQSMGVSVVQARELAVWLLDYANYLVEEKSKESRGGRGEEMKNKQQERRPGPCTHWAVELLGDGRCACQHCPRQFPSKEAWKAYQDAKEEGCGGRGKS